MDAETPVQAVETTEVSPVTYEPMEALREVMKSARFTDGLLRGLREVAKAVDSKRAVICLLAADCDNQQYTKLVTALCKDREVPLMQVESKKTLGEWAGLCRFNEEGEACKVVACSSACLTNWGEDTAALAALKGHIKNL
ncbi:Ribosomal protein S12e [Carpediemonas membranifera]|uniref:40S ribosomal protein S12 n=1 Tax=Carpediemonas membranifera TaxID=201153 RepID=A0A8J6BGJ6_9EUKA|nr:Ribosomal protein S12e [Carpediemonas membranifera]|eukprot:KAG9397047.1 Ribosomal protein S12e [Carpediemonas membranifera]